MDPAFPLDNEDAEQWRLPDCLCCEYDVHGFVCERVVRTAEEVSMPSRLFRIVFGGVSGLSQR